MRNLPITGDITLTGVKKPDGGVLKLKIDELLIEILRKPNQQRGADYHSMGHIIKVMRKIEAAKKESESFVLLENSEHDILKDAIENFSFAFNDIALFEWLSSVVELPEVKVTPTE